MIANSVDGLLNHLEDAVRVDGDRITVLDESDLKDKVGDLVSTAVFADGLTRDTARWSLWELGQEMGIYPSSIHQLYRSIGRGEVPHNFTVPAINVRGMNYEMSRAIFRAANKLQVGALIFEIARSEIGYTAQRPAEYVSSVIGAAIKEGFRGPLFIQGDHFQVSASGYHTDPEKEVQAVKDLIAEAVDAGFYNIDIDTSTLVDLEKGTLDEQQRVNYQLSADLTEFVRELEPEGVTVSLGGEIGEVGEKNSTVPELRAYMDGYLDVLDSRYEGISKISVQTGTSHGGVVLPDGTLAAVSVDFDTLKELSAVARDEYNLGGAVQHGASTLPEAFFDKFPEIGTLEIHLATGFQNIIYDTVPEEMANRAYEHIRAERAGEWKEGQTEEQFLYKTRKKAFGPLKQEWWEQGEEVNRMVGQALEEQFEFLFEKLNVGDTRQVASDVTTTPKRHRPRPTRAVEEAELEIASDLSD
ncbi:MAG: class II fructose-bisphosphate aldolase [Candidatus Promineifilaceae bacterium]|nr:class II fructose-bisphosphate aldolase [Candidatus Promineifilaceae bacterium]